VPIDGTRIITNLSSGRLGTTLAQALLEQNVELTALEGPVNTPLVNPAAKVIRYRYYEELAEALKTVLKTRFDVIIHAAAVADFQLAKPFTEKINSRQDRLDLSLVPTEKLILSLREAQPTALIVGFKLLSKLTKPAAREACRDLFDKADCDFVVANSTSQDGYQAYILDAGRALLAQETSREALTQTLMTIIRTAMVNA
jgi:phosphopantothenoylcysteine decarboxylase/phosphopantothenate--cysteine ligase